MKKILIISLALILVLTAAACRAKKTEISPEISSSDEALFKLGESFLKKDVEKARLYLRQVMDSFPKSFYAQRAKLAIADSYYKMKDEGNQIIAIAEYREFISLYPSSPSVAYAQYRISLCFYEKSFKPGRDQQKTWQALAELKKVIANYPLAEEAKLAREKIKECEEKLAEHNFTIGLHYYKTRAFRASTSRLTEILTNFPAYSKMDSVYFYLGDSFFKWNKADQSIPYFTKLVSDFPKSKYTQTAQERLEEIDKSQKKANK